MGPNGETPAPTPWEQMGLPAIFTPGPVAWYFAKLQLQTAAGTQVVHVLIFDTTAGRFAIALAPDDFGRYITQAQEHASGLTIARDVPPGMPPTQHN